MERPVSQILIFSTLTRVQISYSLLFAFRPFHLLGPHFWEGELKTSETPNLKHSELV